MLIQIQLLTTLYHGLLICIPFSVFVIITFYWNPRLWLHSLPKDISQMVEPKTVKEVQITKYLLLPTYLLILPGLSIASLLYISAATSSNLTFLDILVHLYGIWIIVHLWDFFIIDGGFMVFTDPLHPPISGTEGAKGWKDIGFHFRSFLKAVPMSGIFVIPVSLILSFII